MLALRPEKTALSRKGPSAPTLHYEGIFRRQRVKKILDYGCGKGADVEWLKGKGYEVFGFDPHYAPVVPEERFDAVMLNYVLCVIPNADAREAVLNAAWDRVNGPVNSRTMCPGFLCVAVRSKHDVDRAAKTGKWEKYADGWVTGAGTFQRGFTKDELLGIAGLRPLDESRVMATWSSSWSKSVMVRL